MKFRSLIIRNIFRNKSRSFLAILGIAIGAAAILGLGLVTDGLAASTQQALTAGAADFSVIPASFGQGPGGSGGGFGTNQSTTSGFSTEQVINQSTVDSIQQMSGVASAAGIQNTTQSTNASSLTSSSSPMVSIINFMNLHQHHRRVVIV